MDDIIDSLHKLKFYIYSDRIIRGLSPERSIRDKLLSCLGHLTYIQGGPIIEYQRCMRYLAYYQNK